MTTDVLDTIKTWRSEREQAAASMRAKCPITAGWIDACRKAGFTDCKAVRVQEGDVNIDKRNDGHLFTLSADLYLRLANWNSRVYGHKPTRINRKPAHRKMTDAQLACLRGDV